MAHLVIGFSCAGMAVALMLSSIWFAASGQLDGGVVAVMMALCLLLAAVAMLRPAGKSRL